MFKKKTSKLVIKEMSCKEIITTSTVANGLVSEFVCFFSISKQQLTNKIEIKLQPRLIILISYEFNAKRNETH